MLGDDRAVEELPLRLAAYGLLAAAFTAVAYVGLSHTAPAAERGALERELGGLAAALEGLGHETPRNPLAAGAPIGATRRVSIAVPVGAWLSLGGDADPDGSGTVENATRVAPEAVAVYRVQGDAKRRLLLPIEIREGVRGTGGWLPANQPLYLGPGRHEVIFEAVLDPATGRRVALAWMDDGMDLPFLK